MTTMIEDHVPAPPPPTAVIAMGGHAFIQPGERGTYEQQAKNARAICAELMVLVLRGYRLVITHGNGPQVGDLLTRIELTRQSLPPEPLDALVAQTEGSLGYLMQRSLLNEMRRHELARAVVTMVTQVLVAGDDPAFQHPTKPVGPFLTQAQAEGYRDAFGWVIGEQKGRGFRRMVPSPRPLRIVQADMVRKVVQSGAIVIAGGGGGIPVTTSEGGELVGVEAVIDKDLTSGVLATDVAAELLVILTSVDGVYLHYGEPNAIRLGAVTLAECEGYMQGDHFPAGSMGPKVEAMHGFLQRGGRRGLITSPERLKDALDGRAGTHFIGRI